MFDIDELREKTSYELWVLEYIRKRLYEQIENTSDKITFIWNDRAPNGNLKKHYAMSVSDSLSGGAVKNALAQLKPLSFSSAFKIQDMIMEWILNENNVNEWRFARKIKEYKKINNSNSIKLPNLFKNNPKILKAFFMLYENLEPLRSAIIHSEHKLLENGDISSIDRGSKEHLFNNQEQASYIRFVCLLLKMLLGIINGVAYYIALIENDIFSLSKYQSINITKPIDIVHTNIELLIPKEEAKSIVPFEININFEEIIKSIEIQFPGKNVYFTLEIRAELEDRILRWNLSTEDVPLDEVTLQESDPNFGKFLTIEYRKEL